MSGQAGTGGLSNANMIPPVMGGTPLDGSGVIPI